MRLLLDTCLSGKAKSELEALGHDVVWSGDWPKDPGDDELLAWAHQEKRILVTLDKDFGELAVAHGKPHHGIIRLANISVTKQANMTIENDKPHLPNRLNSIGSKHSRKSKKHVQFPL